MLSACGGGADLSAQPFATTQSSAPPAATSPSAPDAQDVEWAPGMPNAPAPRRVRLARLDIDAVLDPLSLDAARELLPPQYGRAGWYEAGPEPGEPGRVVIAGHVDSKTGPDVFAALGRARAGDRVEIRLADSSTVTYRVRAVEVHPRNDFPTDRVYGKAGERAELRLITCTGEYDRARGGYQDNVVVFADLTTDTPQPDSP
ncbi:MAG: class F sortase [Sporichthyaceae bacterium]